MADIFSSQVGIKNYEGNPSDADFFKGFYNLRRDKIINHDPFITGYAFIVWTKLPLFFDASRQTFFKNMSQKNFKSFSGLSDINLNSDNMQSGFGADEYGVPTVINKENNTFTLRHYELQGSPIRDMYQYWVTGIRDIETNVATYHGKILDGSLKYSARNHTGELLYIVTDPSGALGGSSGIEFAAYFTGVYPTKIPMDHLNYSSGDHSLVEIDIEFRGNLHMSKKVNELASKFLASNRLLKHYGDVDINVSALPTD
jgi:hypothetical protein